MNTKGRKVKALLVCILFITVLLVSLFYIEKEINHNCIGDDCPVCINIQQAEQTIRTIGAGSLLISSIVIMFISYIALLYIGVLFVVSSLVSKKVRMNN